MKAVLTNVKGILIHRIKGEKGKKKREREKGKKLCLQIGSGVTGS